MLLIYRVVELYLYQLIDRQTKEVLVKVALLVAVANSF